MTLDVNINYLHAVTAREIIKELDLTEGTTYMIIHTSTTINHGRWTAGTVREDRDWDQNWWWDIWVRVQGNVVWD